MWGFTLDQITVLQDGLARLNEKKKQLDEMRPLPSIALQRIRDELNLEWTYNSNSIEGNTLTLQETRVVLEEGMTVKGRSLKEHLEVTDHHEAIGKLELLVSDIKPISEKEILDLHQTVLYRVEKDFAGRYRNMGVRISGANFIPPNARKVPDLMEELVAFVSDNPMNLDVITLAALFHHRFVWIHPFFDGNGRTVRLVMNLLLMRAGYPPAIILSNDRKKYYDALNRANNGSYQKIVLLVMQGLERSLDIYLGLDPDTEDYRPISDIVEEGRVPYGQEYISLLARRGKIDAYKEGCVWYTTEEAVEDYRSTRKRKR